jgi:hypothetical protein
MKIFRLLSGACLVAIPDLKCNFRPPPAIPAREMDATTTKKKMQLLRSRLRVLGMELDLLLLWLSYIAFANFSVFLGFM